MVFAQHFIADVRNGLFIGHRHRVNCNALSIHVYRAFRVRRDLLLPATIAATH